MTKNNKQKNILITHVYSNHNAGDAAILSVLIKDVKKAFPGSKIDILTFDYVRRFEKFEGAPIYQSFMGQALSKYSFHPFKLIYSLYLIFVTLLAAVLLKLKITLPLSPKVSHIFNLYQKADLIVGVGGGYISAQKGLVSTIELLLQLHPLLLSRILRQKVILYSQSIGPFGNSFQRFITALILKHVDLIIAREAVTVNLLKNIGLQKNVIRSVDAAFALKSNSSINLRSLLKIPSSKKIVGITVRKWLSPKRQDRFESSVAALCDFFVSKNFAIVFIPQVTSASHQDDDRLASRAVYSKMKSHENVYLLQQEFNHHRLKSLYSGLSYLVGTRFHSVIFALSSNVPAIAVEYEHKTSGIMNDLGLNRWVIKIEDASEESLINLGKKLLTSRASYLKQLQKTLPDYINKSHQTYRLLNVEGKND